MTNDPRDHRRQNALSAARRLNLTRAELEEAGAPADLIDNYTQALIDAARETQSAMWGPGYIDPNPSNWAAEMTEPPGAYCACSDPDCPTPDGKYTHG